jgi:hypothetical protein
VKEVLDNDVSQHRTQCPRINDGEDLHVVKSMPNALDLD